MRGRSTHAGQNFEHRKIWIRERMEFLAGNFGLDILSFSVISNHLHVMVRNRPDVVANWSDDEVARRWWQLFPARRDANGDPLEPAAHDLLAITSDPVKLMERQQRLSSVSWFMRCLCEGIARRANKEDRCTGRFFEGRYSCQKMLDESAVLACSMYVDLNPIRAGIAETPETSEFTSAHDRIEAEQMRAGKTPQRRARRKKSRGRKPAVAQAPAAPDRWLSPVELAKELETVYVSPVARASNKGFLPVSLSEYLTLLDWTGRQARCDKRGAIPAELSPILVRLGIATDTWVETVLNFGRWFSRAAGRAESLAAEAARRGRRWIHGIPNSRKAFV